MILDGARPIWFVEVCCMEGLGFSGGRTI